MAQACVLAVPKLFVHYRGRDQAAHLQRMGFRELPPKQQEKPRQQQQPPFGSRGPAHNGAAGAGAASEAEAPQFEGTDAYAGRLQGYLLFLGALLQSARLPDGLPRAWQWLARSAARIPYATPCRTSLLRPQ